MGASPNQGALRFGEGVARKREHLRCSRRSAAGHLYGRPRVSLYLYRLRAGKRVVVPASYESSLAKASGGSVENHRCSSSCQDLTDSRVTYEGYFDKSKPEQLVAFTNHLSRAFALVHPTAADTTAMIVIEAAFHGSPCITVNDFALPGGNR